MATRARLLQPLLLLAALSGLFAMHGLADHGEMHGSMSPTMSVTSPLTPVSDVVDQPAHAPAGMGDMAGGCLAVLGFALILLGLAGGTRWLATRRTPHTRVAHRSPGAPRAPPSLIALCVRRC